MELIAPYGAVATMRRNYMRHGPQRNETSPGRLTEHKEPLPNSFVSLRIEEAFAADPALLGTRIAVEAFEGMVELSGIVRWQYQLSWAKQLVWHVGGVLGVRSYIRLIHSAELRSVGRILPCSADSGPPRLEELAGQGRGFAEGHGPDFPAHAAST